RQSQQQNQNQNKNQRQHQHQQQQQHQQQRTTGTPPPSSPEPLSASLLVHRGEPCARMPRHALPSSASAPTLAKPHTLLPSIALAPPPPQPQQRRIAVHNLLISDNSSPEQVSKASP
ncbi:hypothetical protein LPJ66_012305, partial [Kickxella alabastrina]